MRCQRGKVELESRPDRFAPRPPGPGARPRGWANKNPNSINPPKGVEGMSSFSCPHFTTGPFESHKKFLDDDVYGVALDCIAKACSDFFLVHPDRERVLLGKRRVHPQPDWWFNGGRMMPGETVPTSCRRLLKRELGLEIETDRVEPYCCSTMAWSMRQQEPKTNGTSDLQAEFDRHLLLVNNPHITLFIPIEIGGGLGRLAHTRRS